MYGISIWIEEKLLSLFPCFRLNDIDLIYVNEFKYLGHIINNDECDNKDVL